MELKDINPWWKTASIEKEQAVLPRREVFKDIVSYIKEKQIIAINGLRRTGKTVLMHHLIDFLLKKNPKENILYYNFDLADDEIENILRSYERVLGIDVKKGKIFVFLDEIQKHKNWENELKVLYDNNRNLKFFISGSSSLFIEKKTKESLGGRVYSFILEPLTFEEYLEMKGMKFDNKKKILFKEEINKALKHYVRMGGFPELLDLEEGIKMDQYVKELVLDKIIYMDIPNVFEIEEPELLARILSIVSSNPGMIIDYEELADDLSRNRKTISNYVFYLEKAFLIKKLYNYSRNLLTSEKKMKKVYPASTALASLFNADYGKIIENVFLMNCSSRFFSRKGDKEIDFIKTNGKGKGKILPIEIKYKRKVREKEVKGLTQFLDKYEIKTGVVITEDYEKQVSVGTKNVKFIPLWKWLLENKK